MSQSVSAWHQLLPYRYYLALPHLRGGVLKQILRETLSPPLRWWFAFFCGNTDNNWRLTLLERRETELGALNVLLPKPCQRSGSSFVHCVSVSTAQRAHVGAWHPVLSFYVAGTAPCLVAFLFIRVTWPSCPSKCIHLVSLVGALVREDLRRYRWWHGYATSKLGENADWHGGVARYGGERRAQKIPNAFCTFSRKPRWVLHAISILVRIVFTELTFYPRFGLVFGSSQAGMSVIITSSERIPTRLAIAVQPVNTP